MGGEIRSQTKPGHVAQSVASLAADPGVASLIPIPSHTFVECDHEIISTFILLLPPIQEGLLSFTSEKYVHEILVNRLIRLVYCYSHCGSL